MQSLPDRLAEHRGWKQLLCAVGVLLVLAARVPDYWRAGEFVAEDGGVFFADAWNHPWPESLILPYAGHFDLLPRLIAALWSGLPITWQPYAFAATGLALNAVILSAFYLPAFRRVIAPDAARLAIVLFLAIAPNAENLGLLLGLHWYLAFALTLLLLAPVPAGAGARAGVWLLMFVCVWSSPSTLMLAPFALVAWWRNRDSAERVQAALLCGLLLVAGILLAWLRFDGAARTGAFAWSDVITSLDRVVLRGWLGVGLLGPRLAGYLAHEWPWLLDLGALAALAALAAWLWKNRAAACVRPAAIAFGAALLMLLFSLTRTAYVTELARLDLPRHVRYATAPTLLLYVGLGIVASQAWAGIHRHRLALLVALCAALLVAALPGQLHWSRRPEWFRLRDAIPAIGQLKAQFARDGRPASLYVPADAPYWGPVLEVGGGVVVQPETGLAKAINATPRSDGSFDSWLGRFREFAPHPWIEHERWGRLEFTGIEKGRVFFRDAAGRLLFTSPLLYPRLWILDGYDWTLVEADGTRRPLRAGPSR
jgi:hypothetical protein